VAGQRPTAASSAVPARARNILTKQWVVVRHVCEEKEFNAKLCFADFAVQNKKLK